MPKQRPPYKRERPRFTIPCDWCLQDFKATRITRRYCSAKCKQAAYRDRKDHEEKTSSEG